MKKILVLFAVIVTSLCIFFTSCDTAETESAGSDEDREWAYLGSFSTYGACVDAATVAGYTRYSYFVTDGDCYVQ